MRYRTRPRTAYLAGRFERKEEILAAEERLIREANIQLGTRWLHGETDMRGAPDEDRRKWANMNVEDVMNADILITFSEDLTSTMADGNEDTIEFGQDNQMYVPALWARGGRHVEFGIALGNGMSIAVIGPKENLFHYYDTTDGLADDDHKQIVHFPTLDAFIDWYVEHNELPLDAEMPDNETRPQ